LRVIRTVELIRFQDRPNLGQPLRMEHEPAEQRSLGINALRP
jgi:hypothetical protein